MKHKLLEFSPRNHFPTSHIQTPPTSTHHDIIALELQVQSVRNELQQLKNLFGSQCGTSTIGFAAAARLVRMSAKTVKLRTQAGKFPKPRRIENYCTRSGQIRLMPVWRTSELLEWYGAAS